MNLKLRRLLGPTYPVLIRLKTSSPVREANAILGLPFYLLKRRFRRGAFAVDIQTRMGMGAVLSKALLLHALAERIGEEPQIVSTNPLYASSFGEDFLGKYFVRTSLTADARPLTGRAYSWVMRHVVPKSIDLPTASKLFATHFRPAPEIQTIVNAVLAGRQHFDLSIHFRGTDKVLESGSVEADVLFKALDRILDEGPRADIFLGTDDPCFEVAIRDRYAQCTFTTFNIGTVPSGVARHFSNLSPEEKAVEAIVNIFLLAAAPICVRTSSFLSAISKVVNPDMRTFTVNRTRSGADPFPESEILAAENEN